MLQKKCKSNQSGAILILALIFLTLLGFLSGTVMQTSVYELRMARNQQFQLEAFHRAQGIASSIAARNENFLLSGGINQLSCKNVMGTPGCSASIAAVDSNLVSVAAGVHVDYQVERLGPLLQKGFPVRLAQDHVSSSLAYDAALFETRVEVDASAVGQGAAEIAIGVAVLTASKNQ